MKQFINDAARGLRTGDWSGLFTGEQTIEDLVSKFDCPIEKKLIVLANVYMAWGMCMSARYLLPRKFGEGMAAASNYLGISVQPGEALDNFNAEVLAAHKAKYGDRS